eukprot:CAMPEP_0174928372 /NCGR_PEP_ID=MMETSP1355-20121228/22949_1 /TAXON_ID=464990 /ORGANISM="Hemiselmis tepida, Strain CCMP443" /LENGTH=366 /DNA_ID=CAMNT_0016174529 /DNA_START=67 /DNA_END=1167 /DNA_ORIENTATION=-
MPGGPPPPKERKPSLTSRLGNAMFGKKKEPAPAAPPKQNRRLSVTGDSHQSPIGDPNTHGTVTDKAENAWLRYFSLSNAGYEPDGHKKTNQDAFISIAEFGDPTVSIFGVFDGHGSSGHHVSAYVKREFPKALSKSILKAEAQKGEPDLEAIGKLLNDAFVGVNGRLEVDKAIDSSLSGTTAVAGCIIGKSGSRRVVMGNAGDSRAVIGWEDEAGKYRVKELSDDHKPDRPDERERVLSYGGRVEPLIDEDGEPIGPHRVWLPNMMLPGLAMARSIGDDIAATVGVHAVPEIMTCELNECDKFMVIASDGVWEFLSNEQVVEMVRQCGDDGERAAREICARSYHEWRAEEEVVDDITCVVVHFNKA